MVGFKKFGKLDGRDVFLLTLSNGIMEAEFISFGATLRALRVPGKRDEKIDVCLGYDSLADYVNNDGYLGAAVGRHANRISGSRFTLNGQEYRLTANEGENQLHGGKVGFSHKLWNFSCGLDYVSFTLDSPDGDEGFPGNLHVEVRYSLENTTLRIDYSARSDADTVVNLTNHAYFNLGGHASGKVDDHRLWVNAESYTPCGSGTIPTGEIAPVDDTALDLRRLTVLGERLDLPELDITKGYDHNFVLGGEHAASLFCPKTGLRMDVYTSMEGMQVYSAGFLTGRIGKDGAVYAPHHAVCLETQHFPDAINKPGFPSPVLKAGEEYREYTEFVFSLD